MVIIKPPPSSPPEAFTAAADPARFPDQLSKEGLAVWQVRKLYYPGGGPEAATITVTDPLPNGKTPAQMAGEAAANHRSQAFGNFSNSPWARRPQHLTLVKSVVPFAGPETDLLRGLPVADTAARPVPAPNHREKAPVRLEFVSRPAIETYARWLKAQGIEQIGSGLTADLPVVAGEENDVQLKIVNENPALLEGEIRFQVPQGWQVQPAAVQYRVQPSATRNPPPLHVIPPASICPDADLTAVSAVGRSALQGAAPRPGGGKDFTGRANHAPDCA